MNRIFKHPYKERKKGAGRRQRARDRQTLLRRRNDVLDQIKKHAKYMRESASELTEADVKKMDALHNEFVALESEWLQSGGKKANAEAVQSALYLLNNTRATQMTTLAPPSSPPPPPSSPPKLSLVSSAKDHGARVGSQLRAILERADYMDSHPEELETVLRDAGYRRP